MTKLQLYKDQLVALKQNLTDVPSSVYVPDWKKRESRMDKLNQFLEHNDCTKEVAKDACYATTRLILIATTKELDVSSEQINGLNQVVDKLIKNIDLIITNLNEK
ncbi:hypothetical protein PQC65_gp148 [Aeromonas phage pAEv1810]|uniref:hypothetical protein n=1 Tax=Aeromonas phage pAEv1810 TaxID=2908744 RepID=UPI002329271A|nr:hypothetical protein PQC65_gp148 [Aeromonas phage pAEv1810]UIS25086.1 hypothetical protein pAEv1810_148 [Aeromonas phage pAEv1810]